MKYWDVLATSQNDNVHLVDWNSFRWNLTFQILCMVKDDNEEAESESLEFELRHTIWTHALFILINCKHFLFFFFNRGTESSSMKWRSSRGWLLKKARSQGSQWRRQRAKSQRRHPRLRSPRRHRPRRHRRHRNKMNFSLCVTLCPCSDFKITNIWFKLSSYVCFYFWPRVVVCLIFLMSRCWILVFPRNMQKWFCHAMPITLYPVPAEIIAFPVIWSRSDPDI